MVAGKFNKIHKTAKYRFHQLSIDIDYFINVIDFQVTPFYGLGWFLIIVMTKVTLAKHTLILILH